MKAMMSVEFNYEIFDGNNVQHIKDFIGRSSAPGLKFFKDYIVYNGDRVKNNTYFIQGKFVENSLFFLIASAAEFKEFFMPMV